MHCSECASAANGSRCSGFAPCCQLVSNTTRRRKHRGRPHQWRHMVLVPRSAISAIVPKRNSPYVEAMLSDQHSVWCKCISYRQRQNPGAKLTTGMTSLQLLPALHFARPLFAYCEASTSSIRPQVKRHAHERVSEFSGQWRTMPRRGQRSQAQETAHADLMAAQQGRKRAKHLRWGRSTRLEQVCGHLVRELTCVLAPSGVRMVASLTRTIVKPGSATQTTECSASARPSASHANCAVIESSCSARQHWRPSAMLRECEARGMHVSLCHALAATSQEVSCAHPGLWCGCWLCHADLTGWVVDGLARLVATRLEVQRLRHDRLHLWHTDVAIVCGSVNP